MLLLLEYFPLSCKTFPQMPSSMVLTANLCFTEKFYCDLAIEEELLISPDLFHAKEFAFIMCFDF